MPHFFSISSLQDDHTLGIHSFVEIYKVVFSHIFSFEKISSPAKLITT